MMIYWLKAKWETENKNFLETVVICVIKPSIPALNHRSNIAGTGSEHLDALTAAPGSLHVRWLYINSHSHKEANINSDFSEPFPSEWLRLQQVAFSFCSTRKPPHSSSSSRARRIQLKQYGGLYSKHSITGELLRFHWTLRKHTPILKKKKKKRTASKGRLKGEYSLVA